MRRCPKGWFALMALLAGLAATVASAADVKPHAYEKQIQAFEESDRTSPPPRDPILFVGSSSIRLWKLDQSFPGLPVLNRGFGGSRIADSVYFCERIVLKYHPRLIVFYAGDNDLAGGETPEKVHADFHAFVAKVHAGLPSTPIVYISIKPSIARWKLIDSVRKANCLIKQWSQSDPLLHFVDIEPTMLGPDGKPRPELFVKDGLHLNARGYALWSEQVAPFLQPPSCQASPDDLVSGAPLQLPTVVVRRGFLARKRLFAIHRRW